MYQCFKTGEPDIRVRPYPRTSKNLGMAERITNDTSFVSIRVHLLMTHPRSYYTSPFYNLYVFITLFLYLTKTTIHWDSPYFHIGSPGGYNVTVLETVETTEDDVQFVLTFRDKLVDFETEVLLLPKRQ